MCCTTVQRLMSSDIEQLLTDEKSTPCCHPLCPHHSDVSFTKIVALFMSFDPFVFLQHQVIPVRKLPHMIGGSWPRHINFHYLIFFVNRFFVLDCLCMVRNEGST